MPLGIKPAGPTASASVGRWLLGSLLVLVPLSAAISAESGDLGQLRSRALALVNQERLQLGLNRLQPGEDLDEAAQAHARDMLRRSYVAHASPEGDTVQDRYIEAGGSRWRLVAENIARCMGCSSPPMPGRVEQLHQDWMNSPGHCENILRRGLNRFGFGIIVGADKALYAVQTFAGPGLPRGVAEGQDPVALPPDQRSAQALQAVNRARVRAGVPPLQSSPALDQAARTLLPPAGQSAGLAPTGDLLSAIPSDQRSRWQGVAVVLGACGGCGAEPAVADVRYFRDQWLDSGQYRATLLDPRPTHLGFAITANGEGAKTAIAVMGTDR